MTRRNFLVLGSTLPIIANAFERNSVFESPNKDIYVPNDEWLDFVSALKRINRVKRYVGYGNFNIISFDHALFYGRNTPSIGEFTKKELDILDKLFYEDPKKYGFYGKKVVDNITTKIVGKEVQKVPRTGHYLYKGKPLSDYKRLKKDIGLKVTLTSGIRGVVKQMSLYMGKIYSLEGNMTQASQSLAPPAYTYHAISDFDVGRKGFGRHNFTTRFVTTQEFKKLRKLDYISMRYKVNNKDGVRYEPWHIEVI
jgi:hypothetical protein